MSDKPSPFRARMRKARPDVVAQQQDDGIKVAIAKKLRTLRDARGMTQMDVANASGMTQSSIARIEALSGPTPGLESIQRYVKACGGLLDVVITDAVDQPQRAAI